MGRFWQVVARPARCGWPGRVSWTAVPPGAGWWSSMEMD